jgi:Lsr2.
MAQRIVHQLVDDIDGTVLEIGTGETVTFSLDGKTYEIDLTEANAAKMREAFAPYIKAGRTVSVDKPRRGGNRSKKSPAQATRDGGTKRKRTRNPETDAIRTWAKDNGYEVNDRGRVPQAIVDAYNAAQ